MLQVFYHVMECNTDLPKFFFHVIWFLNMASAYRNMMVEITFAKYDLNNHTSESYFLIDCCGSFGIFDKEVLEKILSIVLKLDDKLKQKQVEGCNYDVNWCLFITDTMQQAMIAYDFELKQLYFHFKLG